MTCCIKPFFFKHYLFRAHLYTSLIEMSGGSAVKAVTYKGQVVGAATSLCCAVGKPVKRSRLIDWRHRSRGSSVWNGLRFICI